MSSSKKRQRTDLHLNFKKNSKKDYDLTDSTSKGFNINDAELDSHPLKVGNKLVVTYRDNSHRLAQIVEVLETESLGVKIYRYYIHYYDFNRRMDEWIGIDRIIDYPSKANEKAKTFESVKLESNHQQRLATVKDVDHDEHEGLDEASLKEHEEVTKVKNVKYVQLGKYIMECWYFSPFPKEYYPEGYIECLYFCEFTLRFFATKPELVRYQSKPDLPRAPPGNEIYRDDHVSMFELDGAVEKIYCQNLCYFAKLFLDHKTLYWDVDPFLFYVLCTRDKRGFHPVGYFSKEKYSDLGYNLACILTFPCMQRKGYGRFLMAFSYELSKKEEKAGSPEKPLSDMGAVGYRSFWANIILRVLQEYKGDQISIMDITKATSILPDDIMTTLQFLGLLRVSTDSGETYIYAPPGLLEELLLKYPDNSISIDPGKLHWAPLYVTDATKDKWSIHSKMEGLKIESSPKVITQ